MAKSDKFINNNNNKAKFRSAKEIPWKMVKKAKRIVIKLGTRALISEDLKFDENIFRNLGEDIQRLINDGKDIVIVSSGAVTAGIAALGLTERPKDLIAQQVLAAVGNPLLVQKYQQNISYAKVAQILVTQEDFSNRISYNNFRNTLEEMLKRRIIPIINENDVVSVNELVTKSELEYNFTDNDILAALVSASLDAQVLILLSDVDGLYTKHPNSPLAEFVPFVSDLTPEILSMGKAGSKFGRGGMASKLTAAEIVTKAGGAVIIAHAKQVRLKEIFYSKPKVTFFSPSEKLKNKKIWLIFGANLKGKIIIDEGAKNAITNGASLLFNGIIDIRGDFRQGDIIGIWVKIDKNKHIIEDQEKNNTNSNNTMKKKKNNLIDEAQNLVMIGRGKVNYSADELSRFSRIPKEMRKEYFKANNIKEIVSHEHMAFVSF